MGDALRFAGLVLFAVVVAASPLLAGTVHRQSVTVVLVAVALVLTLTTVGERLRGSRLRGSRASLLFGLLALLPALQSLPFPTAWRGLFDREGVALLENAPGGLPRFWPLSFAPTVTRQEIGAAVATWMVFLLGLHVASGRRTRFLVIKLIALAGLVGAVSGVAHRVFDIERLYGLFTVDQLLPGPFINPNHAAELYELTAFCSLALAAAAEREVRLAWGLAAVVEIAAALTTLSRGSLLALLASGAVLVLLLVRRARRSEESPGEGEKASLAPRPRTGATTIVAISLFALFFCVAVAFALGAAPIWDEVARTNLRGDNEKIALWRDALSVVTHHPWGIGRQAFEYVYPATKTLHLPLRFQFVENLPLQTLIDVGWLGVVVILLGVVALFRRITWRRDAVEAALLSGLVAVLVHNLVDFGLETLGMRLPFAAVAGIVVGRGYGRGEASSGSSFRFPRLWQWGLVPVTLVGIGVGLAATWTDGVDEIWTRWHATGDRTTRHALAVESAARYPTAYAFPLLTSYDEPLRDEAARVSPRLSALNRAARLCPSCAFISRATAEALLALGRRPQALAAYRDVIRQQPSELGPVLDAAFASGFSPRELATFAFPNGDAAVRVARFLITHGAGDEIAEVLDAANAMGVQAVELELLRAEWASARRDPEGARTAYLKAKAAAPRDARVYAGLSRIDAETGHLEAALEKIRLAVNLAPLDVAFTRRQVELVMAEKRWADVERALEQLKGALRQVGGNVAEVHLLAGQAFEAQGNSGRAALEFRNAVTVDPSNVGGWLSLAGLAEARGDLDGAVRALQKVLALAPGSPGVSDGLKRLAQQQREAELRQLLPTSTLSR